MGDEGRVVDLVVGGAPAGLAVIDLEGRWQWVSETVAGMLGRPAEAFTGLPVEDVAPAASGGRRRLSELVAAGRDRFTLRHHLGHADGHPVPVVTVAALTDDGTTPRFVALVLADGGAAAGRPGAAGAAAPLALGQIAAGVFDRDLTGGPIHINEAYGTIVGVDRDRLTCQELAALIHPEDRAHTSRLCDLVERGGHGSVAVAHRILRPDGETRWVRSFAQRVGRADPHVVGILVDDTVQHTTTTRLSELLAEADGARAELAHQSLHDALTGLPNRMQLLDALARVLARHAGEVRPPVAVMCCDLDRFQLVNESLGHAAGDQLLIEASERMREAIGGEDVVARLGGDQFLLLCDQVDLDGAHTLARTVLDALRHPYRLGGRQVHTTASIGIVMAGTSSAADLARDADAAMHVAKAAGRDRIAVFDEATRREVVGRLELEADLRDAIRTGDFVLHYQPAFRFDGALSSVEALVRWRHPRRGLLHPGAFIPLAEELGLIAELGHWVRNAAASQIGRWQRVGLIVPPVWVNVSAAEMAAGDVTGDLRRCAATYDLPPGALGVELTESTLLAVTADLTLTRVRAAGFPVALDDFGTGFSSLTYLRRHRVDVLKIDRSFVAGLPRERDARSIVAAVVDLAHGLGARIVAEGVENQEQHDALARLGCDAAQGFFLARPAPAERIAGLLAAT